MTKLTVYSMKGCAQCVQAERLLTEKSLEFEVIKVDEDAHAFSFMRLNNHRSMPQIYLGSTLFVQGGFAGLLKLTDEDFAALK